MTTLHTIGLQATLGGRNIVTAKLSFRQLKEHFAVLSENAPIEIKQQRELSESRAKKIAAYINDNDDFIFNGVIAIVDGLEITPMQISTHVKNCNVKPVVVELPQTSNRFLSDGQHRLTGISGCECDKTLDNNFIDVMFVKDEGLEANRRIFVDLNKNAKVTSGAINISFDTREQISIVTKHNIKSIDGLSDVIEFEKTSTGGQSTKLWSINQFSKFLSYFTGLSAKDMQSYFEDEDKVAQMTNQVTHFFEALKTNQAFAEALAGQLDAATVRDNYLFGTAIMLEVLGVVANVALDNFIMRGQVNWSELDFSKIDFSKEAEYWEGRALTKEGKIIKNTDARNSCALLITSKLGLVPTESLLNSMRG